MVPKTQQATPERAPMTPPSGVLQQRVSARQFDGRWRRPLTDAVISSLHEAWYQDVRHALSEADVAQIDANWSVIERRAYKEIDDLLVGRNPVSVADRIAAESENLDLRLSERLHTYRTRTVRDHGASTKEDSVDH